MASMTLEISLPAQQLLLPATLHLSWGFTDPFVVTVRTGSSSFLLERDLLVCALAEPVLTPTWSATPGPQVRLVLGSEEPIDVPRRPLAGFLGQLVAAVPLGAELDHVDVSAFGA